jgi:lipopolysaccharide/colanic/teichoic acid biosynthesis glycosyltransferase
MMAVAENKIYFGLNYVHTTTVWRDVKIIF